MSVFTQQQNTRKTTMQLTPIKKILVIRFDGLSDVILSSVLCNTLKISFPEAHLNYLVHRPYDQLFECDPSVNEVIGVDQEISRQPMQLLKLVKKLRDEAYDLVIDASSEPKSKFISLLSSAAIRIGGANAKRGVFYTHTAESLNRERGLVSRQLAMLKPLVKMGYQLLFQSEMKMVVSEEEKLAMREAMVAQGMDFYRPRFFFSVSSQDRLKKWNIDSMVQVIKHCRQQYKAQIVLFGASPQEIDDVDRVHKEFGFAEDLFTHIATKTLRDQAALLNVCDVFIGNEGELRHIAQAVGIPTITVFSPQERVGDWLTENTDRHQALEWQTISKVELENIRFANGDNLYTKLYNSITAERFIPLVDRVIQNHVTIDTEIKNVS